MEWTDIKTTVPAVWAETAEAIATGISGGGIYIEDYRDLEAQVEAIAHVDLIEQELLDKSRDEVAVHLYIAPDENFAEIGELMRDRLERAEVPYRMEYTGVRQEDWETGWKAYYHAMDIGTRLAVVPSWEAYETDRAVITLDPGMAFGTGTHETTALCLETLDGLVKGGERVLDIGTGSGIEIGRGQSGRRGHRPDVRAHGRRKRGPQWRAERPYGTGGRPFRKGHGCIRRHLRQHRGQCHHPPGAERTRAAGKAWNLSGQRHHRHPQG